MEAHGFNRPTACAGDVPGTQLIHSAVSTRRAAFATVVGPMINELGLPIDLAGNPSLRDLLRRALGTVSAAVNSQDYPYAAAAADAGAVFAGPPEGGPGVYRMRTFATMYNYGHASIPGYEVAEMLAMMAGAETAHGPARLVPYDAAGMPKPSGGTSVYLFLADTPDGGVHCSFRHDVVVLPPPQATSVVAAFRTAVETIATGALDRRVGDILPHLRP
eukprot:TRINITY_DN738_c0_g2_i1.p1 TRINITY_DN738_c0_g2~~TRINITY_DN738_c0_g2_i1.p1  ORF type:complete len:218 (+),score=56.57 TRINITY_DN738_c0_g2_i1:2-655(+)